MSVSNSCRTLNVCGFCTFFEADWDGIQPQWRCGWTHRNSPRHPPGRKAPRTEKKKKRSQQQLLRPVPGPWRSAPWFGRSSDPNSWTSTDGTDMNWWSAQVQGKPKSLAQKYVGTQKDSFLFLIEVLKVILWFFSGCQAPNTYDLCVLSGPFHRGPSFGFSGTRTPRWATPGPLRDLWWSPSCRCPQAQQGLLAKHLDHSVGSVDSNASWCCPMCTQFFPMFHGFWCFGWCLFSFLTSSSRLWVFQEVSFDDLSMILWSSKAQVQGLAMWISSNLRYTWYTMYQTNLR